MGVSCFSQQLHQLQTEMMFLLPLLLLLLLLLLLSCSLPASRRHPALPASCG
jgi:hypothetical protein